MHYIPDVIDSVLHQNVPFPEVIFIDILDLDDLPII
jgi:hypothetical protein